MHIPPPVPAQLQFNMIPHDSMNSTNNVAQAESTCIQSDTKDAEFEAPELDSGKISDTEPENDIDLEQDIPDQSTP